MFLGYYVMAIISCGAIVLIGQGRLWNLELPEEWFKVRNALVRFEAWHKTWKSYKEPHHIVIPDFRKSRLLSDDWLVDKSGEES